MVREALLRNDFVNRNEPLAAAELNEERGCFMMHWLFVFNDSQTDRQVYR
jgi:hypothetical protein